MKASRFMAVLALAIFCMALFAGAVMAEDMVKIKGKIKDFDASNKTVVVTTDDGKEMTFVVENETALKKLGDRLEKGDEVKIKYFSKDLKNIIKGSNDLKGTKAGC